MDLIRSVLGYSCKCGVELEHCLSLEFKLDFIVVEFGLEVAFGEVHIGRLDHGGKFLL